MAEEIDSNDDDDITDADIAAGCLCFFDGWECGKNREMRDLGRHFVEILGAVENKDIKDMLIQALKVLQIEHYIEPSWISDDGPGIEAYEQPFDAWRKSHPRDPSSPLWTRPHERKVSSKPPVRVEG